MKVVYEGCVWGGTRWRTIWFGVGSWERGGGGKYLKRKKERRERERFDLI
jgi:hypothetical protein